MASRFTGIDPDINARVDGSPTIATDHARLIWFKSSYSGTSGGECVEMAVTLTTVRVRDSKNVPGPVLRIAMDTWPTFISFVSNGDDVTVRNLRVR
ncbi:DUF397 domain-containing protein [Streptomyces sp. NPDC006923]|uniref:DUF397 domain-containing protein n=1 Tax=Streptomyces sp. NPDC006923 TaxID=3155355 RepID=UPI0033CEF369